MLLILIISCVIGAVKLANSILFSDYSEGGRLLIMTEPLSEEHASLISEGVPLFDTLTKRYIGEIISLQGQHSTEGITLVIETDAAYFPRAEALCTPKVWFRYSMIEERAE